MSHPHSSSHAGAAVIDVNPPGAEHGQHHGHTIVPLRVLVLTLVSLLFLTLATVGAAQLEKFISHTFAVEIPQWVNITVALSIAAVKTTIVAMFFMQLRYDSAVNSLVLFFTIITVTLFLGFTMLDLGTRGTIYPFKGMSTVVGGTGGFVRRSPFLQDDGTHLRTVPDGTSLAADVRANQLEILHNALVAGDALPTRLADWNAHMLHEIEQLRRQQLPLPAFLEAHEKFLAERVKALRAANKPLPAPIAAFAAMVEEEHNSIPDAAERSSAQRSRVRTGLSPAFAPAGHGGAGAHDAQPGHTPASTPVPDHKPEPAKDKPAH